mmetsp:Transcript_48726/g.80184  ORF Transcript_48726/g.80184 Transcript_48726/m.80184 type:complete len:240 (-) Transcript_48726:965-1684(-)
MQSWAWPTLGRSMLRVRDCDPPSQLTSQGSQSSQSDHRQSKQVLLHCLDSMCRPQGPPPFEAGTRTGRVLFLNSIAVRFAEGPILPLALHTVDGTVLQAAGLRLLCGTRAVLAATLELFGDSTTSLLRPCSASGGARAPLRPMGPDAVGAYIATGLLLRKVGAGCTPESWLSPHGTAPLSRSLAKRLACGPTIPILVLAVGRTLFQVATLHLGGIARAVLHTLAHCRNSNEAGPVLNTT